MARFVKENSKQNLLSSLWDSFSSLDSFTKIFLIFTFLAITITPYFVTNSQTLVQHAATVTTTNTCATNGGACYKYSCPTTGNTVLIPGTCGTMTDSACCTTKTLAKPTGLSSVVWYCKFGTPIVEHDTVNLTWKPVPYATGYTVYHRLYNVGDYVAKNLSGNSNYTYMYNTTLLNGRRVQWYVVAKNSYSLASSRSDTVTTPAAFESCPQ